MNSVEHDPHLIGIDWGTSSLRAYMIGEEGEVLDRLDSSKGIMQVPDNDFAGEFIRLLDPWINNYRVPLIASGMITSRNGWLETPYLHAPTGTADLADALVPLLTIDGSRLHFVTGITTDHNGAPDVMRGEETQIAGSVQAGLSEGVLVMPGTHSKWVTVHEGRIADFSTFMSGEIYQALCEHTILGTLMNETMSDSTYSDAGFRMGVAAGLDAGPRLLHTLFHVRTMPLFGRIDENQVANYLSGMLIGAEIHGATANLHNDEPVTVIGRDDLADRYAIALQVAGLQSTRAPDDIVARGHFAIAEAAGLLS